MNAASYRELKVLEQIAANPSPTQRYLAKELGMALGLANLMIRRLIKKGHVKVVSFKRHRIRYLLTPKGITEKTRLTYEYLEYSLHLYRSVRQVLRDTLSHVARSGGSNAILFGAGEVAEIAYLALKDAGLNLVGVVDDHAAGRSFLGHRIIATEELASLQFDCGIVSSLDGGLEPMLRRLRGIGVPEEKVVVIEQNGPRIRAVIPGLDGNARAPSSPEAWAASVR